MEPLFLHLSPGAAAFPGQRHEDFPGDVLEVGGGGGGDRHAGLFHRGANLSVQGLSGHGGSPGLDGSCDCAERVVRKAGAAAPGPVFCLGTGL